MPGNLFAATKAREVVGSSKICEYPMVSIWNDYNLRCIILLAAISLLTGCFAPTSQNIHLKYGNPSRAKDRLNNYLIERPEYVLSYNCSQRVANWASWQLDRSWLGEVDRSNSFRPDLDLPEGCYGALPNDYRGSGYDRGHLVPSGDRTRRLADNRATFLMSNIIPQAPENNREVWRELEEYSRYLAQRGNILYIVAGGYGVEGKIAQQEITIPEYNWKVLLVLEQSAENIANDNAYTIAVWIPNNNSVVRTDWRDYIVSVDLVEKRTGYNFFNRIPSKLQKQIESYIYTD